MDAGTIISIVISLAGIGLAIWQFKEKAKLEKFTLANFQGMIGNLAKIQQSTNWAMNNYRNARALAVQLPDSEIKAQLITKISDGLGDAVAADRMIINLFNQILTAQQTQFNNREINHPDKEDLYLIKSTKNTGLVA
jgi:hypothetical protein